MITDANVVSFRSLVVLERLKRGWSDSVLFTDSSSFKVLDDRLFTGNPHFGVPLVTSDEMLPNKEKGKVQQSSQNTSLALNNGTFLILEIFCMQMGMIF